MYSLGLNNPPRIGFTLVYRGTVYVKWRVHEFNHLLSSALKYWGLPKEEKPLGKLLSSARSKHRGLSRSTVHI
jgi:hypothetical protein